VAPAIGVTPFDWVTVPAIVPRELCCVPVTVNVIALLDCPPTVTVTGPVTAPVGTGTTIASCDHWVGLAITVPNATLEMPWGEPKLVPEIVTVVPTVPEAGVIVLIEGRYAKTGPVPETPFTRTVTLPLDAPVGAIATMLVLLQLETTAGVPSKRITLVPWVVPRLVPVIVTDVPAVPCAGEIADIPGVTVKL
jgi:hypothetical protein